MSDPIYALYMYYANHTYIKASYTSFHDSFISMYMFYVYTEHTNKFSITPNAICACVQTLRYDSFHYTALIR